MEMSETSKKILTTNENILKSQILNKQNLFTNHKGLTFALQLQDKLCSIGGNGCCCEFEDKEEVYKLFEELEIVDYKNKLDEILLHKSKLIDRIYLAFLMRYNW